jgi:transposase
VPEAPAAHSGTVQLDRPAPFGGVVSRVMVDNLKSAVLQRLAGTAPVFNARYLDYARHAGFTISPCKAR